MFLDIFTALIFFYALLFLASYVLVVLRSVHNVKFNKSVRSINKFHRINILVYTKNSARNLPTLLEMFSKQTYDKNLYKIHIVLDNCPNVNTNLLEFIGGAKIWNLSNDGLELGKNNSFKFVLGRIANSDDNTAFVFMDADMMIKEDFVENINNSLFLSPIVFGESVLAYKKKFTHNIIDAFNTYKNKILLSGRTLLGWSNILDTNICAIKQEYLKKHECVFFQDINSALKYSMILTINNTIPQFNPNIKVYIEPDKFDFKIISLKARLSLFLKSIAILFKVNFQTTEFVFNLLKPNVFLVLAIFACLFWNTYWYDIFVKDYMVFASCALLIGTFLLSLKLSGLSFKGIIYLCLYPFYSLKQIFKVRVVKRIKKRIRSRKNGTVNTVDIWVRHNNKNLPCKLDLISSEGLYKCVLRFNKKKLASKNHLKMQDAIEEISANLNQHDFCLKICQNCVHFKIREDGNINETKGICMKASLKKESRLELQTLLWNDCKLFLPSEVKNILP